MLPLIKIKSTFHLFYQLQIGQILTTWQLDRTDKLTASFSDTLKYKWKIKINKNKIFKGVLRVLEVYSGIFILSVLAVKSTMLQRVAIHIYQMLGNREIRRTLRCCTKYWRCFTRVLDFSVALHEILRVFNMPLFLCFFSECVERVLRGCQWEWQYDGFFYPGEIVS